MRAPTPPDDATSRRVAYGLAGGVGTTTVAAALNAIDGGVYLGIPPADRETTWPVLVVPARPDQLDGLQAAVRDHANVPPRLSGAVTVISQGRSPAPSAVRALRRAAWLTVAIAADGHSRLPTATRALLRTIDPFVRAVVHIPYVARWRWAGVDLADPPRRWRRAIDALAEQTPIGAPIEEVAQ